MKCTQLTRKNQPCQAHALKGSQPPTCSAHAKRNRGAGAPPGNQNRRTHGFYSTQYTTKELSDLVNATTPTLLDEIALTRIATRRILEQLDQQIESTDYAKLAGLLLSGANTIARLLRVQRILSGETADGIAGAIGQALDELSAEFNIEL